MTHVPPDLNEVATFLEVVRHMNLSSAARALRVSTATVSRRLTRLEERLSVQLLDRSTRGLALTQAGESYAERAARGLELIVSAEEQLQELTGVPQGVLRVGAPTQLLGHRVGAIAIEYARRYPGVELHIIEADHWIDMDEADLHIAIQVLPNSKWESQGARSLRALTRRTLGTMDMIVCASPEYLERHGPITHPQDLLEHPCVVLGANPTARLVQFYDDAGEGMLVEVPIGVFTTNVEMCRQAAIAGLGPAGLTWPDCRHLLETGELVRVIEGWRMEPVRCIAVFVDSPRPPQRARAFLDLLAEQFTGEGDRIEPL